MTSRHADPIARMLSILGHPLLLLSLALLATVAVHGNRAQAGQLGIGLALCAAGVLAYSWWQVRRKRWRHVDASGLRERRHLNVFLLALLGCATLLAGGSGATPALVIALALSAALVCVALATARWCTLSLHLAFATYAALLLAPLGWGWLAAMLAFAAGIAWSRLQLARHRPRDLVAGAVAGLLAGACFLYLVPAGQA